jgi:hypothetical protein
MWLSSRHKPAGNTYFFLLRKLKVGEPGSTMTTLDGIVNDIISAHGLVVVPSHGGSITGWTPGRELGVVATFDGKLAVHNSIVDSCLTLCRLDRLLQRTVFIRAIKKDVSGYECAICRNKVHALDFSCGTVLGCCPVCEKKCQEDAGRLVSRLVLVPAIFWEDCGSLVARFLILAS